MYDEFVNDGLSKGKNLSFAFFMFFYMVDAVYKTLNPPKKVNEHNTDTFLLTTLYGVFHFGF
jgi:hypothetical protein